MLGFHPVIRNPGESWGRGIGVRFQTGKCLAKQPLLITTTRKLLQRRGWAAILGSARGSSENPDLHNNLNARGRRASSQTQPAQRGPGTWAYTGQGTDTIFSRMIQHCSDQGEARVALEGKLEPSCEDAMLTGRPWEG